MYSLHNYLNTETWSYRLLQLKQQRATKQQQKKTNHNGTVTVAILILNSNIERQSGRCVEIEIFQFTCRREFDLNYNEREGGGPEGEAGGRSNYQCITEYLRVFSLKPIGNFCTGCLDYYICLIYYITLLGNDIDCYINCY